MTTIAPKMTLLESTIAELTARLEQALDRASRLEKTIDATEKRVARGTVPPPPASKAPAAPTDSLKLRMRRGEAPSADGVREALYLQPCDTATLAGRLDLPVSPTLNMLRVLQREGKVVNVGSVSRPLWTWVIGDDTPTADLSTTIEQLIKIRPMSLREIMAATGARMGRVSGVLVRFQRTGRPIENRGNARHGLWFLAAQ